MGGGLTRTGLWVYQERSNIKKHQGNGIYHCFVCSKCVVKYRTCKYNNRSHSHL